MNHFPLRERFMFKITKLQEFGHIDAASVFSHFENNTMPLFPALSLLEFKVKTYHSHQLPVFFVDERTNIRQGKTD